MGPIERMRRARAVRQHLEQRRESLYRLALAWCNDPFLADDLVQQAATKALSSAAQLRCLDHVDRWIVRILSNCWHDHLRHACRDPSGEPAGRPAAAVPEPATPEGELEREATARRVRSAMARLSADQRQVIALVDLEGYSYAEAAEVLGVPIGTVMSRLCRGRRHLRDALFSSVEEWHEESLSTRRRRGAIVRRVK